MRRKALVNMLELMKPALADEAMVPIYQNFCFDGETVYAFDDALAIVGPCETGVDPFSCHGGIMLGLLRNCRTEDVDVEFDNKANEVVFIAGRAKMRLPYLPAEEFLFQEPEPETWAVGLEIDDRLLEAMEICLTTAGKDTAQEALMGLTLNIGDGVNLYSCDADAISHFLIEPANDSDAQVECLVPSGFWESVMRICKAEKNVHGKLFVSDDWALAKLENDYRIYGRIIKPKLPVDHADSIERQLRGKEPPWVNVPKGLEHALSRARIIAEPKSAYTEITIKDGRMILYTNTDLGEVRDSVNIHADHPDMEAKVNAALMARSIAVCSQMAVLEDCTVYRKGIDLFQIVAHRGD